MKICIRTVSVLLALSLIAGLVFSASAYSAELALSAADYESDREVMSVVTYQDGTEQTLSFAPDIAAMDKSALHERIRQVEIYVEREPVLSLGMKTYYTAEFPLPGTQKTVFLSGLSSSDVSELETKIIEGCEKGESDFSIEDLSFIDAEKRRNTGDGDDNLCWAATASNLLTYTGWAEQAGFETTDDVFDLFTENFSDGGGSTDYGVGWFINGVDTFHRYDSNAAGVKNYGASGAYLTDCCYQSLVSTDNLYDDYTRLFDAMRMLREGYGVGLSVRMFLTSTLTHLNGHAVTMWGYVTNDAYTPEDAAYYDMLIISDSDSNELWDQDRRAAKNELDLYKLSYTELAVNPRHPTRSLSYSDGYHTAVLYTYNTLVPYSGEIEVETSEKATKDMTATQELAITSCYLSGDITDESFYNHFDEGENIYFTPILSNIGDYPYSGRSRLEWTLYDASGKELDSDYFTTSLSLGLLQYTYYPFEYEYFVLEGLQSGSYTLTMSFNATETVSEAYYYNNTYSVNFSVGDIEEPTQAVTEEPAQLFYLLGDADGDNDVTVLDATLIQRVIAGLDRDDDGRIHLRGDVFEENDLTVLSATLIQRYLAGLVQDSHIGEKRAY